MKYLKLYFVLVAIVFTLNSQAWGNDAVTYFKKGVDLAIKGDINGAITNYQKAILLDPMYSRAYNNLGYMYQQKGDTTKAIENYQKALDINPKDDTAHSNLGTIYISSGRLDEGIEELYKTLELDPGSFKIETDLEKAIQKKALMVGKDYNTMKQELDKQHANKLVSNVTNSIYTQDTTSLGTSSKLDINTLLKDICQE